MSETEDVNIKKTLAVFDVITSKGSKQDDHYLYNGLKASSDFDGYNITIKNDYVELTIFFHNKFSLDYSSKKEKASFLEKIEQIYQSKKRGH